MIKGVKGLLGAFGAQAGAAKLGGDRASAGMKGAGGDRGRFAPQGKGDRARMSGGERAHLKQDRKDRAREIAVFKGEEGKEEAFARANYFLEREEEMMRAMWRKRRR